MANPEWYALSRGLISRGSFRFCDSAHLFFPKLVRKIDPNFPVTANFKRSPKYFCLLKQRNTKSTNFAIYLCNHPLNLLKAHTFTIANTSAKTEINGNEPTTYDIHFADKGQCSR